MIPSDSWLNWSSLDVGKEHADKESESFQRSLRRGGEDPSEQKRDAFQVGQCGDQECVDHGLSESPRGLTGKGVTNEIEWNVVHVHVQSFQKDDEIPQNK